MIGDTDVINAPAPTIANGLRELALEQSEFVDLGKLPHLRELRIDCTNLDDQSLSVIVDLPSLELLSIAYTRVTDSGISQIGNCRSLKSLCLRGLPITGRA